MKTQITKYEFKGIKQDVNPGKHPAGFLFDAKNLRYLSTSESISGAIAFEKGNLNRLILPTVTINRSTNNITLGEVAETAARNGISYTAGTEIDTDLSIPAYSDTQEVIGQTVTRDSIILFSTDGLGMDCVWVVDNSTYRIQLKYLRNLGFSKENPIQAIFNYENENIQKVYWIDGVQQIRSINLEHNSIEGNEPLIDLHSTAINFVGVVEFSQPYVRTVGGGGTHTAGMIQYAYNLFRLNSSQTKVSPLSELIPLSAPSNLGGGDLNEQVGAVPVVVIDDIDNSYTHINVYAIKYTSLNQIPSISLIEEKELGDLTSISVYDDGTVLGTLSLEEFLFLGSEPSIPQHIETKDNNLFLFNIKQKNFVLPDELDTRAYSFPKDSTSTFVYDNITLNANDMPSGTALSVTNTYLVPEKHDSINLYYDDRKYQYNSSVFGGEGKYLKYEININPTLTDDLDTYRFFKDREIYRIGIQFYNRLGQVSFVKWIADFKSPSSNLSGNYGTLKVDIKPELITFLASYAFESEDDRPVGYKVVRADRNLSDKTIICQGMLSGMMVNSIRTGTISGLYTTDEKKDDCEVQPKMPNFLTRTFEDINPLKANSHLEAMQFGYTAGNTNPYTEVQYDTSERKADTYQYTTMYQMNSPEIQFGDINLNSSLKFNVIGGAINTANNYWGQERRISTKVIQVEGKTIGGVSPHGGLGVTNDMNGQATNLMDRGLISNTNGSDPDKNVEFNQWYREFKELDPAANLLDYHIYGTPEFTERGQGRTVYNNKSKYEYTNSLEGFLSDGEDEFNDDGDISRVVLSLNSYGGECVTFVSDSGSQEDVEPHTRPKMEDLFTNANLTRPDSVLLSEFVRPNNDIYLAGIYGGNSYEDKKRTSYVEIGEYQEMSSSTVQINSPGDTYVQDYRFMRIGKTDTEIYSNGVNQVTEIVSVLVETGIDLKNRNDISNSSWDSKFQPRYDDYNNYNKVYSQISSLVKNTDTDFTFKRIKNFDTRIQATKTKIPNETVDSWTDFLTNETIDLDGKYGPINGVVSFRDKIYTFQDNAFALISINPRIQSQGSDDIAIELASGSKLHDYNYISTRSGAINKWGIVSTERAIYFLDGLNKRFQRFTGQLEPLSETKGMHTYFENNLSIDDLRIDNPLLSSGVSIGFDQKNSDIYLTYNNTWTLAFNELLNEFTSFYDYNAPIYIWNKEKFLTISNSNRNELWETHAGDYNNFYGENKESSITFIANPTIDHETIFNNLEWKSIAKVVKPVLSTTLTKNFKDVDADYTWETVQVWNEFQKSKLTPTDKLRKLNRKYRLALPRDANTRDRMRSNWVYIKLTANNEEGYFYTNQSILLYYMSNYIVIQ